MQDGLTALDIAQGVVWFKKQHTSKFPYSERHKPLLNTPAIWPCAAVELQWWQPRQLFHSPVQAPWTNVKQLRTLGIKRERGVARWHQLLRTEKLQWGCFFACL